jgi:hypothetical protein
MSNASVTITRFQGYGNIFTGSNVVVTIPASINNQPVTTIGSQALYGDYSTVGSIIIPSGITSIGIYAFSQCTYLTNALIGNSVTNISDDAFEGDNSLNAVYFFGNTPASGDNVFTQDRNATAYYIQGTIGWSNSFDGIPAVAWNPPLPPLGIAAYSNRPVLFFPLPASFPTSVGTNFVLQMTTNLGSSNWVNVTNGISFICVQITNAPSNAFFRLK